MGNVDVSTNSAGDGGAGGDGGQKEGTITATGADGGHGANGGGLATALAGAELDGVALDGNQAGDGGDGGLSQEAQNGDGGMGGGGGGWYSEMPRPLVLLASTVTGNAAGERGCSLPSLSRTGRPGGGIRAVNAGLTVERSTIAGNTAGPTVVGGAGSGAACRCSSPA